MKNVALEHEYGLLKNDIDRLKRKDGNNSSNSSLPPSTDEPKGRVPTPTMAENRPKGKRAQYGHKGHGISKEIVEERIRNGDYQHSMQ